MEGLSHRDVCVLSPPNSPPIWAARTLNRVASGPRCLPVLKIAVCACPFQIPYRALSIIVLPGCFVLKMPCQLKESQFDRGGKESEALKMSIPR